jgi:endonuclease I
VYGFEDGSDSDSTNDRERNINDNCTSSSCVGLWNREHVYPTSLATPDLDQDGTNGPPYADAHNLRPCDSQRNSSRGNKKFIAGSGILVQQDQAGILVMNGKVMLQELSCICI